MVKKLVLLFLKLPFLIAVLTKSRAVIVVYVFLDTPCTTCVVFAFIIVLLAVAPRITTAIDAILSVRTSTTSISFPCPTSIENYTNTCA